MPDTASPSPSPPRRYSGGRIAAIVAGSVLAVFAVAGLLAGGALLWADGHKDKDGYVSTHTERFSTRTAALATENLDVNLDGADAVVSPGDYGKVRVRATPRAGKDLFVGIARTRDVNRYLDGVAHDEISDVDLDPFKLETARRPGEGRPAMPAAQTFWAATSTGGRTLDWKVRKGEWSVVTMNADGSPDVRVQAKVGAKVPLIRTLGWGLAIPGVLLGAAAVAFVAIGARGVSRSR